MVCMGSTCSNMESKFVHQTCDHEHGVRNEMGNGGEGENKGRGTKDSETFFFPLA